MPRVGSTVGADPDDEDAPIPGLHHYVGSSLNFGTTLRLRNAESPSTTATFTGGSNMRRCWG